MLNALQLQRLLANGNPSVAIDRVLTNGRDPGRPVRQSIASQGVVDLAARSLVVQRACELLYQPQAWLDQAATGLQAWVHSWIAGAGKPASASAEELIAAALAVLGMAAWVNFKRFQPQHGGGLDHGLGLAVDRLAEAVRRARGAGRLSETDAAAIRWQVRDRAALRPVLAALDGGEDGRVATAEAALAA